MFDNSTDRSFRRPAIPSQLSADREFAKWLSSNKFESVVDADGAIWKVFLTLDEPPSADGKRVEFCVKAVVAADFTGEDLVRTGALSRDQDERLIKLLGKNVVPLTVNGFEFRSNRLDEARSELIRRLPGLRKEMSAKSFCQLKRDVVVRLVEQNACFGGRVKNN